MKIDYTKLIRCTGGAHYAYTAIVDGKTTVSGMVQVDDQERPEPVTQKDTVETTLVTTAKANPKDSADALKVKLTTVVAVEPVAAEGVR